MPDQKTTKVVRQQPTIPAVVPQEDEAPIKFTVTVNDPGAIAYAVAAGFLGAVLDRLFGGQSNHDN